MEVKHSSPLLPLRDIVVFPSMVIPLFVGRDKSITALNEVMKSDKKIIQIIGDYVNAGGGLRVLDIGCSTGYLLKHIKHKMPNLELTGGDLNNLQIEHCKSQEELLGIQFEVMDATKIDKPRSFDVIIANAMFLMLEDETFEASLTSIYDAMDFGGILVAFDQVHEWAQDVTIIEKSGSAPDGIILRQRPKNDVEKLLQKVGFMNLEFSAFDLPIDLPKPPVNTRRMETYTVSTVEGPRLQMRGVIAQPWSHIIASKVRG